MNMANDSIKVKVGEEQFKLEEGTFSIRPDNGKFEEFDEDDYDSNNAFRLKAIKAAMEALEVLVNLDS